MSSPAENNPNPRPPERPSNFETDSLDVITIIMEGPGEKTKLPPLESIIPRDKWPRPHYPRRSDTSPKPPENGPQPPDSGPTPPADDPQPPQGGPA